MTNATGRNPLKGWRVDPATVRTVEHLGASTFVHAECASGVVLAAELTGGYALILPLIVTCVTANAVAQALGSRPLYELLLERTLRLAGKVPPPPVTTGVPSPVGLDEGRAS